MPPRLKCDQCQYSTTKAFNLNRHKRTHQNVGHTHYCTMCNYSTSIEFNFLRHVKSHENSQNFVHVPRKDYYCLSCGLSITFPSRRNIKKHFVASHGLDLKKEELKFNDLKAFFEWKESFEKKTVSRFVNSAGPKPSRSKIKYAFRCHRDGIFIPRGKGKRDVKFIGSNKIGSCCPAEIKAGVDKTTLQVTAEVVSTHFGHDLDVRRLPRKIIEKQQSVHSESDDDDDDDDEDCKAVKVFAAKEATPEIELIVEILPENTEAVAVSFEEEKKKVKDEMDCILDCAQTLTDLEIIRNALAPVTPAMRASTEFNEESMLLNQQECLEQSLLSTTDVESKDDSGYLNDPTEEEPVMGENRLSLFLRSLPSLE